MRGSVTTFRANDRRPAGISRDMNELVRWQPADSGRVSRGLFPVLGVACAVFGAVGHRAGLIAAICATLLVVAVAVGVGLLVTRAVRQS